MSSGLGETIYIRDMSHHLFMEDNKLYIYHFHSIHHKSTKHKGYIA